MSNLIKLTLEVNQRNQLVVSELMNEMNFTEDSRKIFANLDNLGVKYFYVFITFVGKKSDLKPNLVLCRKNKKDGVKEYFSIACPNGCFNWKTIKDAIDSYEKYENIIKEI